jgi:hypothetical protein
VPIWPPAALRIPAGLAIKPKGGPLVQAMRAKIKRAGHRSRYRLRKQIVGTRNHRLRSRRGDRRCYCAPAPDRIAADLWRMRDAVDVFLVLWFLDRGFPYIEALVLTLLCLIGGCFAIELTLARPDLGQIAAS